MSEKNFNLLGPLSSTSYYQIKSVAKEFKLCESEISLKNYPFSGQLLVYQTITHVVCPT